MISQAIYSILKNNAGVAALLGTKIYPITTPQETEVPFCIYQTSTEPTKIKNSASPLDLINVDFVIFDDSYQGGRAIVTAIRTALDRYSGTVESNVIQETFFQDDRAMPWPERQLNKAT